MSSTPAIIAEAFARYRKLALQECFDASRLDSRPTKQQQDILDDMGKVPYRWVISANQSGKSSLAAREIAWILTGTHPTWKRPSEWGTEPLLVIVAGQDRKMMEIELWAKKIKPFLDEGAWREARVGGSLQYIEHRQTKDKIVFLSHNDSSEKNRIHMQGYVAHYVWMDEMCSDKKILEELQRRVDARRGYFIATFTPKFRNEEIRKIVECSTLPLAKKYRLFKLDNPLYKGREAEELQKLEGYPEGYKNSILYGEWYIGDNSVYQFDRETMVRAPEGYSPGWRHVESVDPAMASRFGFTLWAENPADNFWYLVRADYIEGIATPEKLVEEVKKRTEGFNIVRRISDPHEAWYIQTASSMGVHYTSPFNKNARKQELIKGLQSAFGTKIYIAPWCTHFLTEVESCQWSESGNNKIISSSSYHLLDSAQYFVDCKPPGDSPYVAKPWHQELREANKERKKTERMTITAKGRGRSQWLIGPGKYRRLS